MLKSKIPLELKKRGLAAQDIADAGIVSRRIAFQIANGSVSIRLSTLAKLCDFFEVRFLDDLIEYVPEKE